MYACLIHGVPFAQVRAVSNVVERRNRDAWKLAEAIEQPGRRPRCACSMTHDADARLLAVPERLLHVRRDRASPHRSRGARVQRADGGHRGAERGGVRRRGRRHQAELPRLRLLRRQLRAARRRQRARAELRAAADLEARDLAATRSRAASLRIAIPGKYTTANFLLSAWRFRGATDKTELLFSAIEAAVLDGTFDAGLIIHENRFTYEAKGLQEDHRPRRVLGRRDRRADPARRHRRQPRRCRTTSTAR